MEKYVEDRSWGSFEQFCYNQQCTVKLLNINPNKKISLQYHEKRDEFWRVLSGNATFIIRDKTVDGEPGTEFFIRRKDKHQIIAGDEPVQILEVSFGEFDEGDIVRVEAEHKGK